MRLDSAEEAGQLTSCEAVSQAYVHHNEKLWVCAVSPSGLLTKKTKLTPREANDLVDHNAQSGARNSVRHQNLWDTKVL